MHKETYSNLKRPNFTEFVNEKKKTQDVHQLVDDFQFLSARNSLAKALYTRTLASILKRSVCTLKKV